jgi:hypothetical protein
LANTNSGLEERLVRELLRNKGQLKITECFQLLRNSSKPNENKPTLKDFFKLSLEDASSECRQYARQAFLAFYEIFPDEAEPLIVQFRSTFLKHKEMIDRFGSILDGEGTKAGFEDSKKGSLRIDRKTQKQVGPPKVDMNLAASNTRRTEFPARSQNRLQNKFLSEERELPDKGKIVGNSEALGTGFKNIKISNVNQNTNGRDAYVSKYIRPTATIGLE